MLKPQNKNENDLMDKIVSLCKRRGFIFPGSEIYGGLANSWDYGPYGVEIKNNLKQKWWKVFVQERDDMVGLDAAIIMNPDVWEASGHLKIFSDPLVECKACHNRFRSDTLEELKCPDCGGEFTSAKQFNLMFKTFIGPSEETANIAYLRPETAQGIFVNFKNILNTMRKKLPFGVGQIGKAFRNEITPGNFIFRTREFEQMEIEYFIAEDGWEKHFEHWKDNMTAWAESLGLDMAKVHLVEIPDGERAHYSKRTIDFEYEFPFGQKELYGLAYRTNYDLTQHGKISGEPLEYADENGNKFIPHVIEPSLGVDRSVLAVLCAAYHEEEAPTAEEGETDKRVVMKFPSWLAPIKIAILPLSKKENLSKTAREVYAKLRKDYTCEYDETQSIGKRYRRQDEIGTPYCVTVDFESLNDGAVTVRERDTMKQERIAINKLGDYFKDKFNNKIFNF